MLQENKIYVTLHQQFICKCLPKGRNNFFFEDQNASLKGSLSPEDLKCESKLTPVRNKSVHISEERRMMREKAPFYPMNTIQINSEMFEVLAFWVDPHLDVETPQKKHPAYGARHLQLAITRKDFTDASARLIRSRNSGESHDKGNLPPQSRVLIC